MKVDAVSDLKCLVDSRKKLDFYEVNNSNNKCKCIILAFTSCDTCMHNLNCSCYKSIIKKWPSACRTSILRVTYLISSKIAELSNLVLFVVNKEGMSELVKFFHNFLKPRGTNKTSKSVWLLHVRDKNSKTDVTKIKH